MTRTSHNTLKGLVVFFSTLIHLSWSDEKLLCGDSPSQPGTQFDRMRFPIRRRKAELGERMTILTPFRASHEIAEDGHSWMRVCVGFAVSTLLIIATSLIFASV